MRSRLTHLIALLCVLAVAATILTPVLDSNRLISVQANPAPGDNSLVNDDLALSQLSLLLGANLFDSESSDSPPTAATVKPSRPPAPGDMKPRRRPVPPVNPAEWPDERQFRESRVKLTPELLDRCVEVAHDVDPAFGQQLATKRERNPQQFESVLRNHAWRVLALAQLKQRDPELYSVKLSELSQAVQVNRVAANLRKAMAENDETRVETLKSQLRTMLQIQLAMSIKARGEYLCRLEEQLQNEREAIDREATNFQATVDGRLNHYMYHVPAKPIDEEGDSAADLIPVSD